MTTELPDCRAALTVLYQSTMLFEVPSKMALGHGRQLPNSVIGGKTPALDQSELAELRFD